MNLPDWAEPVARYMLEEGLLDDFVVYRYDYRRTDDGVGGPEGGFNMCTFWLIEALTRAGRASRRPRPRTRSTPGNATARTFAPAGSTCSPST